jgi:hypothetical protein
VFASNPNNQKFVKQLIEEGTKIIHVPNPDDPLKPSDRERSVQLAGFMLLRLLALQAGYHRLKTFSRLSLQLIVGRLKSSSQLVCKINEKIYH